MFQFSSRSGNSAQVLFFVVCFLNVRELTWENHCDSNFHLHYHDVTQHRQHLSPEEVAVGTLLQLCLFAGYNLCTLCTAEMTLQWIKSKETRLDFIFFAHCPSLGLNCTKPPCIHDCVSVCECVDVCAFTQSAHNNVAQPIHLYWFDSFTYYDHTYSYPSAVSVSWCCSCWLNVIPSQATIKTRTFILMKPGFWLSRMSLHLLYVLLDCQIFFWHTRDLTDNVVWLTVRALLWLRGAWTSQSLIQMKNNKTNNIPNVRLAYLPEMCSL